MTSECLNSENEKVNTRSERYSPKVEGPIPVSCNFFAEFILL